MPETIVYIYREESGESPFLDWLRELNDRDERAADACIVRIHLLAAMGSELRRPHADLLREGIYELRAKVGRVNYRILYFFHGRNIAIVSHGLTKESAVPEADIKRAIVRKSKYEKAPQVHRATLDPERPGDS